ncbi:MAG: fumarylacetoacetate hydrolase family protein, partial [Spirochaetota bacterium]
MSRAPLDLPVAGTDEVYRVAPSKIIALGLNYRDHIAESASVQVQGFDADLPSEPVLFPKLPSCLTGPGDPIVLPAIARTYGFDDPRTDYEAELALFVSHECRDVGVEHALDYVYGYTCMNDVSQRNIQNGDRSGWFRGKSFDTFGPIGPRLVLQEDLGDPQRLHIETRLNGAVVQQSNTSEMIFDVPAIVSFISRNFTLEEGDVIVTGTPSGVGP